MMATSIMNGNTKNSSNSNPNNGRTSISCSKSYKHNKRQTSKIRIRKIVGMIHSMNTILNGRAKLKTEWLSKRKFNNKYKNSMKKHPCSLSKYQEPFTEIVNRSIRGQ